jgi:cytochrome d ubiquinol oxidase subunit II
LAAHGNGLYLTIYKFWLKIFAMGFGVGVVTGIVLSFEFGLGFSNFAKLAGALDAWRQRGLYLGSTAAVFALVGAALARLMWRSSPSHPLHDRAPMLLTFLMLTSALLGCAPLTGPNIIPFRVSLWEAASGTKSHVFLLIGAAIVTPVILAYSAFAFYVFRGKTPAEGWES